MLIELNRFLQIMTCNYMPDDRRRCSPPYFSVVFLLMKDNRACVYFAAKLKLKINSQLLLLFLVGPPLCGELNRLAVTQQRSLNAIRVLYLHFNQCQNGRMDAAYASRRTNESISSTQYPTGAHRRWSTRISILFFILLLSENVINIRP